MTPQGGSETGLHSLLNMLLAPLARIFCGYDKAPPSLKPVQSSAIQFARVLCIVGIVYAHAWTGRTTAYIIHHSATEQGILRWVLVEMVGRSSVPLLGMVSGWLVASSALKRSYWQLIGDKARTIIAPMIAWNIICLVLVLGAAQLHLIYGPRFEGWGWAVQEIFALWEFNDINFQMPFLRDLFVCMCCAPLLVRLRNGWLLTLLAVVAAWTISGEFFPLILRPQVALFFLIGVGARRWGLAERVGDMPFAYAALPFAVLGPIKVALSVWGWFWGQRNPEIMLAIEMAMRLAAALLMWRLCLALAARPGAAWIRRFEPYSFLLFCSHMIMIWLSAQAIGRWSGPLDTPGYPVFLIGQPLLVLGATIVLGRLLVELLPGAARFLSGGRLKADSAQRPVLAMA